MSILLLTTHATDPVPIVEHLAKLDGSSQRALADSLLFQGFIEAERTVGKSFKKNRYSQPHLLESLRLLAEIEESKGKIWQYPTDPNRNTT